MDLSNNATGSADGSEEERERERDNGNEEREEEEREKEKEQVPTRVVPDRYEIDNIINEYAEVVSSR